MSARDGRAGVAEDLFGVREERVAGRSAGHASSVDVGPASCQRGRVDLDLVTVTHCVRPEDVKEDPLFRHVRAVCGAHCVLGPDGEPSIPASFDFVYDPDLDCEVDCWGCLIRMAHPSARRAEENGHPIVLSGMPPGFTWQDTWGPWP